MTESQRKVKTLIVGAGPTGLGAATRLNQEGERDWLILDQADGPGGLACTHMSKEGFHFDMGGHVIFSHYKYFDELLDAAVGTGSEHWDRHQRVSYVIMRNQRIPYPFQFNIRYLPQEEIIKCIMGLIEERVATAAGKSETPKNFGDWMKSSFGQGITDVFMKPYNFKVWAHPGDTMSYKWIGERVATVDLERVIRNVVSGIDDASWGPNATFRFPRHGGTGGIWKSVAKLLPKENQVYGIGLQCLDAKSKTVQLTDGSHIQYDYLISTIPLDQLCSFVSLECPGLQYSSTHVVGLGLRGNHNLQDTCWMYFPEDNCPFYRTTVFSNYSPNLTPKETTLLPTIVLGNGTKPSSSESKPGPYWSLMMEVSESIHKPVEQETLIDDCIKGALASGLITETDEVVSTFHLRLERGYPTPSVGREETLNTVLPWLMEHNILSRGRFGAWKYEVANQDHSLMQGVEAADAVLKSSKEYTVFEPSLVNTMKAPSNNLSYAN